MKKLIYMALLLAGVSFGICHAQTTPPADPSAPPEWHETEAQRHARLQWFLDARFGMFIHWGLYSIPGGVSWKDPQDRGHAEWYLETTKMPVSQYEKFADQFNPVKFNADAWAQVAQDAGVRYVCITSMHHDGFAMFPSKVSDRDNWSLSRTPFGKAGRDPLMELKQACEKRGIRFCLYHTIMDWHSPLYINRRDHNDVAVARGIQPDMDKFQAYLEDSVTEAINRYHPAMLWFDGNWEAGWNDDRGRHLAGVVRRVEPSIIINNRVGGTNGDYLTPEQTIPAHGYGPDVAFESCMTMSGANYWGFNRADFEKKSVKSTPTLLGFLIDLASKGGNMLLNVGPSPEGEIPSFYIDHLREMGAWLSVNGDAIYGTRAGLYVHQPTWGRTTTRVLPNGDTRVYAIILKLPKDHRLVLPGVTVPPLSAQVLGQPGSLPADTTEAGVAVTLPDALDAKLYPVVAFEFKGAIDASKTVNSVVIEPAANGAIQFFPHDAELNQGIQVHGEGSDDENLGYWTDRKATAEWNFNVPADKAYRVNVKWSAQPESAGSVIHFVFKGPNQTSEQIVPFTLASTGSWEKFTTADAGTVTLPAGKTVLSVRVEKLNGIAPCNLGVVTLTPE